MRATRCRSANTWGERVVGCTACACGGGWVVRADPPSAVLLCALARDRRTAGRGAPRQRAAAAACAAGSTTPEPQPLEYFTCMQVPAPPVPGARGRAAPRPALAPHAPGGSPPLGACAGTGGGVAQHSACLPIEAARGACCLAHAFPCRPPGPALLQLTHLAITDSLPGPIICQSSQGPAASAKLASMTTDGPTGEQHPADVFAAAEWRRAAAALASALAERPAFYHLTVPTAHCDTEAARAVHLAAQLLSQLRPATIVQEAISAKQPLQRTFCAPSCPRF